LTPATGLVWCARARERVLNACKAALFSCARKDLALMTTADTSRPPSGSTVWLAAETIWDFLRLGHTPAASDVVLALGCHDIGVADTAADVYKAGHAPLVVASGGVRPGTKDALGGGEAVVFRSRMIERGVPAAVIVTEERARHTGENFTFTRDLLTEAGRSPSSVLVVCMPYMERRAAAIAAVQWPEVEVRRLSSGAGLGEYTELMWRRDGVNAATVIANAVGDLDRIWTYPALGLSAVQPEPAAVRAAFEALVDAGFGTKRAPKVLMAPLPR
jgi:uncharacterized SAM-binding protein YcdF (DUF218 family)